MLEDRFLEGMLAVIKFLGFRGFWQGTAILDLRSGQYGKLSFLWNSFRVIRSR